MTLPDHAKDFYPNMGFGMTVGGFSTSVNIFNYYNTTLLGAASEDTRSMAELSFYDFGGKQCFVHREWLEPHGSIHLGLRTKLLESKCPMETYGSFLCRLIPQALPAELSGKPVSTEFIVEVASPSGAKSFVHNVGCPVYGPNHESKGSEQIFSDRHTSSKYMVLINNYHGPRVPLLSHGRAHVRIANHRGESISSWSKRVPARGTLLFSFEEHFPQLREFLDGQAGAIYCASYNLIRKSLMWVVSPDGEDIISFDHF